MNKTVIWKKRAEYTVMYNFFYLNESGVETTAKKMKELSFNSSDLSYSHIPHGHKRTLVIQTRRAFM